MDIEFSWDNPNIGQDLQRELKKYAREIKQVPERAIRRGVALLTRMIRHLLQKKGLMMSRALLRSITFTVKQIGRDIIEGRIFMLKYGRYLEEGTGLYGPLKKKITPKTKKALAWGRKITLPSGKTGREFVRRSVKGIHPTYFISEAVRAFIPQYYKIIQEELAKL